MKENASEMLPGTCALTFEFSGKGCRGLRNSNAASKQLKENLKIPTNTIDRGEEEKSGGGGGTGGTRSERMCDVMNDESERRNQRE